MSDQAPPEWLPDWRDIDNYPDPIVTTKKQWAWEFLRRNSQYRSEWCQVNNDRSFGATYPPGVEPRPEDIELNRHGRMLILGGKWGLSCPAPDPALDSPEILVFQSSSRIGMADYEHSYLFEGISLVPSHWEHVTIIFDLTLPLDPQLDEARTVLAETKSRLIADEKIVMQKPSSRTPRGELLLNYLRCLDASNSGATIKEIAKTVFAKVSNKYPDFLAEQRTRDSLKAAHDLVASKYRLLDNESAKK